MGTVRARVVVLAGGTGGAKLARGMADVVDAEDLTVIANSADDIDVYGVRVSPDPDLVTYWLADLIDTERGWGVAGETFYVHEAMTQAMGVPWFKLGDRDLAVCMLRTELLANGHSLTDASKAIGRAFNLKTTVLPMCDEPVATYVRTEGEWRHFQRFLIQQRAKTQIEGYEFRGIGEACLSPQVASALAGAEAIVIGPSNPVASIGPVLAVPGMSEAIKASPAPVIAVSPLVEGRSLKGPTEAFLTAGGHAVSHAGVADLYGEILDGLVCDGVGSAPEHLAMLRSPTRLSTPRERRELASAVLAFADRVRGLR